MSGSFVGGINTLLQRVPYLVASNADMQTLLAGQSVPTSLDSGTGSLTSGGSNTKGAYVTIVTTTKQWNGITLSFGNSDQVQDVVTVDIATGAGPTIVIPDISAALLAGAPGPGLFFRISIASGVAVKARVKYLTAGGAVCQISIQGG